MAELRGELARDDLELLHDVERQAVFDASPHSITLFDTPSTT